LQTKFEKHEFVGYGDIGDKFTFIVIPAFRPEIVPGYKLIQTNTGDTEISLDKLNDDCVERIRTAINTKVSVAAYLKSYGYVGVGRITETARMIRDVRIKGKPLLQLKLKATDPGHDCDDEDLCEYVCLVKWLAREPRENAKKSTGMKLFTNPQVRASLDGHPKTVKFIEREFGVSISKALNSQRKVSMAKQPD
jgi:hypothetical protein